MPILRSLLSAVLLVFVTVASSMAFAGESTPPSKDVAAAKQLLDTYYGNEDQLRRAAKLLDLALQANERDADALVQAARLVVMGGHIVRDEFRSGTAQTYHSLLDRALAVAPSHPKAHLLKAEAFHIQRDYAAEKVELERTKTLNSADPWLWFALGRYQESMGDYASAQEHFLRIEAQGPGSTAEQRRAYIAALNQLARYAPRTGAQTKLKALAVAAVRERHPADSWTLGSFADAFLFRRLCDDAIAYARDALRVMPYGAAKRTLAASLYCKAAQVAKRGDKASQADRLVAEADSLGVPRNEIRALLQQEPDLVAELSPELDRLLR